MKRTSPCVGICSTTYGDLVCRGCNRFAHEIVEWNGFSANQRRIVWNRLQELHEGAVGGCIRVCDHNALLGWAEYVAIPDRQEISVLKLAYEVLRSTRMPVTQLGEIGIELCGDCAVSGSTRDLLRQIDQEFYARSMAHYEHNFKIAAQ